VLAALVPDDHGQWAPLLAELRQRLADLVPGVAPPPDADASADDLARRRPGAELDRWIRVRDRHCVAPSCRRPAHRADLDHTVAHGLGGPTSSWNLGAWCRHHHRAKHHAGWIVRQPTPGRFEIRTRAGLAATTSPRRVCEPLPEPRPTTQPRPLPAEGGAPGGEDIDPGWFRTVAPRRAAAGPRTPATTTPLDDLDPPPF
jgi:hypothetical protein